MRRFKDEVYDSVEGSVGPFVKRAVNHILWESVEGIAVDALYYISFTVQEPIWHEIYGGIRDDVL